MVVASKCRDLEFARSRGEEASLPHFEAFREEDPLPGPVSARSPTWAQTWHSSKIGIRDESRK